MDTSGLGRLGISIGVLLLINGLSYYFHWGWVFY